MIHTIYRNNEIIVAVNGIPYVVSSTDSIYDRILAAIKVNNEEELYKLLTSKSRQESILKELEKYHIKKNEEDCFSYYDNYIGTNLNAYLDVAIQNNNWMPVVKFITRLYENPTHRTRMKLFNFMTKNELPIREDGSFIAYKAVDTTYMDKHSKTIYNGVGTTVPLMPWSQIDTDNTHLCSNGYHVCSKEYLTEGFYSGGDRVISVSVPPEYVGAIPKDYNGSKVRCRQYTVLADITEQFLHSSNYQVTWHKVLDPKANTTKQRPLY